MHRSTQKTSFRERALGSEHSEKSSKRVYKWLLLLTILVGTSLASQGCGGEVLVSFPGCEDCPDRCVRSDKQKGKCAQCLTDKHCQSGTSSTRKCIEQKCVCGTDADCPTKQKCAGTHGCVECLRNEHCKESDRPICGPDSRCAACKLNMSQVCLPKGSNACVKGTQTCKSSGHWGVCEGYSSCTENEKCVKEKCVLDCPKDPCKETEAKCTTSKSILPGKYLRCIKNKKGCLEWTTEEKTCGVKEFCDKGSCNPYQCPAAECKLDQMRCVGSVEIRTCIKNTSGCLIWSDKKACPKNTQCRLKEKRCTLCLPNSKRSCYGGPAKTKGEGLCKAGSQTCLADGSGYDNCAGEVKPKKELCNNKDDDCDGKIDENYPDKGKACRAGAGICEKKGQQICKSDGMGLTCDAVAGKKGKESCNGMDDDCDGKTDEGLEKPCYTGVASTQGKGICKAGKQICKAGKWEPCIGQIKPKLDVCNGKDDDCDGSVDENLSQSCYAGPTSTQGKGICKSGKQVCKLGKWGSCIGQIMPKLDVCNGKDDDCDGSIDELLVKPCYTGPVSTQGKGNCKAGRQVCKLGAWSACTGESKPKVESCNNQDDDCDGNLDENLSQNCYSGPASTQGKGICKSGKQTCKAGKWEACKGDIKPKVESCNNQDDDCDGNIDEALIQSCYTGPISTKGKGNCKSGKQACAKGSWGACLGESKPKVESCNNQDDDCDGVLDENLTQTCYTGPAKTKGVGLCQTGKQTCQKGKWSAVCSGQVIPVKEHCSNKQDDNCDGRVDECGTSTFVDIRKSIDTDHGKIDGVISSSWVASQGTFRFSKSIRIPLGARIHVTGSKALKISIIGDFKLDGSLLLVGGKGGGTNCQSRASGIEGVAAGGGAGKGGKGAICNTSGSQPTASSGTGISPGKGGQGGSMRAGSGGGAGHAIAGKKGTPSGVSGVGGKASGSATALQAGGGGGGGGCGVASSFLKVYTPGAGGGGGGGAIQITTTGNLTILGSLFVTGGDGGVGATCGFAGVVSSTGGGGAGGAGGSIYLRAKKQISLLGSAQLSALGGKGKGTGISIGGNGSYGFIRLEDSDGKVSVPSGRVTPVPTFSRY